MREYKTYYLFLLGLIGIFFMPILIQKGMFVDGLWYATIANNLSNGLGTFWQPMLTETMAPEFYSHPPLVFWLQSLFFDVFTSTPKYFSAIMSGNFCPDIFSMDASNSVPFAYIIMFFKTKMYFNN